MKNSNFLSHDGWTYNGVQSKLLKALEKFSFAFGLLSPNIYCNNDVIPPYHFLKGFAASGKCDVVQGLPKGEKSNRWRKREREKKEQTFLYQIYMILT